MRKSFIGMLIAFCAFQFMFVSCLFTKDLPFTNYTADDGLAQSEINFILQDSKGYLWFATWKGISRFDGQVFTNYTVEDGLAHNAVKAMLEDKHSVLWFGTFGGGVSRFDGKTWRTFTREDGLADNFVNTIFEDTEGNLWFGTEKGGASRFDGISWETFTNEDGLANNQIEAILEDTEGNLWFGAVGGLSRFDGEIWESFTTEDGLANTMVYSMIEKSPGELWFGTFNGISRFDGNQWRTFTIEDGLVHNYVHSIYQDSEGNLWFGTQGGVSKFDGKTWTSITEDGGLVNNTVETILEDTEGNLWFGTVQGVSKLGGLAFLNYTEEHGLADNKVLSIMEDVRGHLWFGTYGGGASRFDGVRWETFSRENGLAVDFVYSILEDSEGNLWFGTNGGGVNLFDRKNWRHFTSKDGAGSYVFYTIYEDTKGNLWFGTDNGVSRFDGKNWRTFTKKDGLTEKAVYTIIEDNKGNLWFGTYGGGVNRFDGEEWWSFTTKNGLVNDFVLTNFKDAKGNLWFGTERGLSKYDGKSFFNYTTKNGLSDNNCCFITGDDNYLYVGTSKGVNRFDGKTFKLYTTQDGLAANEMNRGACLKDSKGDLWFGTTAGVSKYNPQLDEPNLIPPPVYINRISLLENDSTITYVSELKHSENFLRFDYAGICFTAPEALIYHYKLEGSDTDWQESTLRTVQYTHLPSGHYTFKVNARNKDGIWSERPAEFSFVIAPAFWNTWWFRFLSSVLLVGIIYGVFKEWHKRKTAEELKEKNVRLENTLERLTQEIAERKKAEEERRKLEEQLVRAQKMESLGLLAGGVAHDLNNILSGLISMPQLLSVQIDMMLGAMGKKSPSAEQLSEIKKSIETISSSGQRAADVVRDLLTIARIGVTVTGVLNLNNLTSKLLSSPEFNSLKALHPNIKFKTNRKSDLLNIRGSETHLLKSLLNLVTNAAEAMPQGGNVTITTRNRYIDRTIKGYDTVEEGDYAVLTVADTGTGIPQEDLKRIFEPFYTKKEMGRSGTGLGMSVVWGTVKNHDGYIDVDSIEGKGTTFTLYFPTTGEEVEKKNAVTSIEGLKGHGETILVVDDVEEQREIASRILTTLGYDVKVVSSGEEAIEYLRDNSADLLLLDMIMDPGIDGLDTYKGIVQIHPGQKAVIDSGFSVTERVKEAQRLGAGAYVKKPYTLEKLGMIIRQELHKK